MINSTTQMLKFIAHSRKAASIAVEQGWHPGARYTNLRDVRCFDYLGFLDINWKSYDFQQHLAAARSTRPYLTVARDILNQAELNQVLDQAWELAEWSQHVIIVPKDRRMADGLSERIPNKFLLGFSVPTRYGGTLLKPESFKRPVHLLGGRPDQQRRLAELMPVVSLDCNRFTLDAQFGDYFDGTAFRRHPAGGYERCMKDSVQNINELWNDYTPRMTLTEWQRLKTAA